MASQPALPRGRAAGDAGGRGATGQREAHPRDARRAGGSGEGGVHRDAGSVADQGQAEAGVDDGAAAPLEPDDPESDELEPDEPVEVLLDELDESPEDRLLETPERLSVR